MTHFVMTLISFGMVQDADRHLVYFFLILSAVNNPLVTKCAKKVSKIVFWINHSSLSIEIKKKNLFTYSRMKIRQQMAQPLKCFIL